MGAPPLDRIAPEHFPAAYDRALAEHSAEVAAIAENRDPPSFDNTILALEKSGKLLTRLEGVFGNLTSAATSEALQAIELEMAPRLSAHWSAILMHPVLFARLDALVTAGANQMNGINFSIREPAPLLEKARAAAVADARARAETYAKAAGVTLGPVQSISEGSGAEPPRPMYRMAAMAERSVPVATGEESVTADVSIVWEIR